MNTEFHLDILITNLSIKIFNLKQFVIIICICIFFANCTSQLSKIENKKNIYIQKYDIAFDRETIYNLNESNYKVHVIRLDSNKDIIFDSVYKPVLSSDGEKLLITKVPDLNDNLKNYREILNLNTMQEQKLEITCKHLYEAWSPDDNLIAFIIYYPGKMLSQIGIIKTDNSDFRILDFSSHILLAPSWTNDGKYIVTSDLKNIYKIGVKQYYSDTINIFTAFGDTCSPSSETKFYYSSDNRYLIFNAYTNKMEMESFLPSPEAIYAYDTQLKKIIRLTPVGMNATDPCLGVNDEIYFTGTTDKKQNLYGIYKVDVNDKKITLVIDKGEHPSCRRY